MQINAAVLSFDFRVLCPPNAAGLIPLYDSHSVGGNRPPAALSWGLFTNSSCVRRPPPSPFGVVGIQRSMCTFDSS